MKIINPNLLMPFLLFMLMNIAAIRASNHQNTTFNYPQLIDQIRLSQATNIKDNGTMDAWVNTMTPDGKWTQFTYGTLTTSTGTNTTDNHIIRLWHLAAAVSKTGHARYNNQSYKDALKKGLEFWHASKTTDPNWWYNRIYFPQKIGEILIFLREFEDFIPQTSAAGIDQPELMTLFVPQAINDITAHGTGANATDIGLHYVYRGLLTADSALLVGTRNRLELILADNIKGDMVYHDHGPQIQISSYGWVFCDGIIRLASYLSGSPAAFDINSPNFSQVVRFIRETQIASIRGTSWDFSVMGRAVSRVNALNANLNYLQRMADSIDPDNAGYYRDVLERLKGNQPANYKVESFNKHYWVSDYTQHSRPGYLFTVRNVSTRTVEAETGNGENLRAHYFSHGATFISVDGNEYKNIMPYWDWAMIPGTTFPHTTSFPTRPQWGVNYGATTFVGGVSDGINGASVLNLSKSGITAKKSWFFFDDEIVCLGAGINDASNRNVRTTINQTKMETPSYHKQTTSTSETMHTVSSQVYSNEQLKYIRQGKVAYFFPDQGNVKYTMRTQSGAWRDINNTLSATIESGYVFSLWFDHGNNPTDATYSYVVVPGIDTEAKANQYSMEKIEILENTSTLQAVVNRDMNLVQAIFHNAGTLQIGNRSITVNRPCALMIRNGSVVTISDPTQSNSLITVTIESEGKEYRKFVSLPTSTSEKGSSVSVDFEIPTSILTTNQDKNIDIRIIREQQHGKKVSIVSDQPFPVQFQLRTVSGQLLHQKSFTGQITIDLQQYDSGVYIISAQNPYGSMSKKLIN